MTKPIDRSEAVNLARNWIADPVRGITDKGIETLAVAVLRMDSYISAALQEAVMIWRSCETDAPHEGQEVLVWSEGLMYLANRVGPGRWSDFERSFTLDARAMWRPLPEHPKQLPQPHLAAEQKK